MERHEQTGILPEETVTTKTYQKDLFQTTIASCSPVEVVATIAHIAYYIVVF
jgi:hypothetical protein